MRRSYLIGIGALAVAGVAFALAARSERRGARVVDPLEADRAAARAQMEAARAQVAAAHDAADDAAIARQLAGPRPGQPGPLFDAIHFGSAGISAAPALLDRLGGDAARAGVQIGVEPYRLTARVPAAVADRVFRAWGDPPRDRELHDAATHAALSVSVDGDRAIFSWQPYETIDHLIDPGDGHPAGTTPFSIVGQRVGMVSLALGDRFAREPGPDPTARRFTWNLPRLDDGGYVIATADVDDGVITRVTVDFEAPPDDVAAALRATYGGGGEAGPWRHGALTIELDATPRHASVSATRAK